MYRMKLAASLREAGYAVSYTQKGVWRLDKVSYTLEDEFSQRRKDILAAKKAGRLDMDAWRETRSEKDYSIDKTKIVAAWHERTIGKEQQADVTRTETIERHAAWVQQAGWSLEAEQERQRKYSNPGISETERWQYAIRRATDHSALVTKEELVTEYINELMREEQWENNNATSGE